jgi:hypothetical protein
MEISTQARIEKGSGAAQFEFQQWMEILLKDITIAELDGNPRPELVGYHGSDLHVVPNLTYLDPSAVAEPQVQAAPSLMISPTVVDAGGCVIRLCLGADAPAVEILDVLGRRCATLRLGSSGAGVHSIRWDGTDGHGRRLPSGVYWIRPQGTRDVSARVLVLR